MVFSELFSVAAVKKLAPATFMYYKAVVGLKLSVVYVVYVRFD